MHDTLNSEQFMLLKQAPHFHIVKFSCQLGMDLCSLSLIGIIFLFAVAFYEQKYSLCIFLSQVGSLSGLGLKPTLRVPFPLFYCTTSFSLMVLITLTCRVSLPAHALTLTLLFLVFCSFSNCNCAFYLTNLLLLLLETCINIINNKHATDLMF